MVCPSLSFHLLSLSIGDQESELEPTEKISYPLSADTEPTNESSHQRPLLGFSPTQQVEDDFRSISPELSAAPDQVSIDKQQAEDPPQIPNPKIFLGFSQSQCELAPSIPDRDVTGSPELVPPNQAVLLGFTPTQRIPHDDEINDPHDKEDHFIFLSHMTGDSQYTFSTCPSQSQPNFSSITRGKNLSQQLPTHYEPNHEIVELSGDSPNDSSFVSRAPSLETVPSIQSNRFARPETNGVCQDGHLSVTSSSPALPHGPTSEGWMTSKKNIRDLTREEVTQSCDEVSLTNNPQLPSQEEPPVQAMSSKSEIDILEMLRKLQEKEKELLERETLLQQRERDISLQNKEKASDLESVPLPSSTPTPTPTSTPAPSSTFSAMNRSDSLSQGGVLAVDGLLQLKHAEPVQTKSQPLDSPTQPSVQATNESRFQWSSLKKIQNLNDESSEPSVPQPTSRLARKKIGIISQMNTPTKSQSPAKKSSFDFEPSSPERLEPKSSRPSVPPPPLPGKTTSRVESSEECEWNSQEDIAKIINHPPHPSTSDHRVTKPSSHNSSVAPDSPPVRIVYPNDIPPSLHKEDILGLKWSVLWKILEDDVGWFWQRGRGLVTYAYCRPESNYSLAIGDYGTDIFFTQDEVLQYLLKYAPSRKPAASAPSRVRARSNEQSVTRIPFTQSDDEQERSVIDHPAPVPKRRKLKVEESSSSQVSVKQKVKVPESVFDWRHEVKTLPWPELWSNLQAEGWTWDHGSGLVTTWFMKPGVKKHSLGIVGSTVFSSEEDVRDHLLRSDQSSRLSSSLLPPSHHDIQEIVSDDEDPEEEEDKDPQDEDHDSIEEPFDWRNEIKTLPWPQLWKYLQGEGWTWDHGSGLVTTWYLKPGIDKVAKGIAGFSIFQSEEEVRQHLLQPYEQQQLSKPRVIDKENEIIEPRAVHLRDKVMSNWKDEVKTLPWPELWSNLQAEGWTWDHGSGLVTTWYLKPGIEKYSKGIVGFSVFRSEDEVRDHLLHGNGTKNSSSSSSSHQRNKQFNEMSDSDDWELVKNRKKRHSTAAAATRQGYQQSSNSYYSSSNHSRKNNARAPSKSDDKQVVKKARRMMSSSVAVVATTEQEEATQQQVSSTQLTSLSLSHSLSLS
jgi:hypothetical protein